VGFSSDGSDTPRATASDLNETVRLATPVRAEEHFTEPSLFDFEQHLDMGTTKLEKQSAAKRLFDKWQALGDRRRAYPPTSPAPVPVEPVGGPVGPLPNTLDNTISTPTGQEPSKSSFASWNRRYRVGTWRKPRDWNVWGQGDQQLNNSATNLKEQSKISNWVPPPVMQKEWSLSTDWRKH